MRTQIERISDNLLWTNINLIQESLGANETSLAKEFGLNKNKFIFYKNNNLSVPFTNVDRFSQSIGISADALLLAPIQAPHLKHAIALNWKSKVPRMYLVGSGSRSFTIRHILKLAKRHDIFEEACATFGLNEFSFETTVDFSVSVQLASDLLHFISQRVELKDEDYSQIALDNSFYLKDSSFGKELSTSRNPLELYEKFMDVVNHLEENWKYDIQYADKEKVIINSYPCEEQSEKFKRRDYSSFMFTKLRSFVGAHLTRYIGLEGALPTVTKSIHYGDSYCQFNINFTNLKRLSF